MIKMMYYDNFTDEYTLYKDKLAPPERYLLTYRGTMDGVYIETWENTYVDFNSVRLDIAYSETDIENNMVNHIRYNTAKTYDFSLSHMIKWTIPPSKFDYYVGRFGLEERIQNEEDTKNRD